MRYHDPALAFSRDTLNYRKSIVEREIVNKNEIITQLLHDETEQLNRINVSSIDCTNILHEINLKFNNLENIQKTKTLKKLNELYNGQIFMKEEVNCYVNLSQHEKEFLNLGLNFHLQSKYDKINKQTELEVLYNSLKTLESNNKITIKQGLQEQLTSEGTKHRNRHNCHSLPPHLMDAAHSLKENNNIVVRRADKSSIYVILDKDDYLNKLNALLSDTSKFQVINRDPTSKLKLKANKLIDTLNSVQGDIKIDKIVGDYTPGYVYGNVKIHKQGNPLRPIISQCPTPTYQLAKTINKIISPYIPNDYSIKSPSEFIDILHSSPTNGIIASLDVNSLFTNVPIDPTIDTIIKHTYHHATLPPPKIPKNILREFLSICTKESPFHAPNGDLYLQIEGVAMGSPLGPTFANFYMGNLEQNIFNNYYNKPSIYVRYIDDIFMQIDNTDQLTDIKDLFEQNSVLTFTYELHTNHKLPFLDIAVTSTPSGFKTAIHYKPTDHGKCLNADSFCPLKYKRSVVNNYIHRAFKYSQTWDSFHNEIQRIKQMLINNNYSNTLVDHEINKYLDKSFSPTPNHSEQNIIPIYYKNQMHPNHRIDENVLKEIVSNNTKCINPNDKLKLIIYYKNRKSSSLVMKNNMSPPKPLMQNTNLIYAFICPMSHSDVTAYVGYTTTTLFRRLQSHAHQGSIKEHLHKDHNIKVTKEILHDNTNIIDTATDKFRLTIKEALLISKHAPVINKQFDNFTNTLKLFKNNTQSIPTLPKFLKTRVPQLLPIPSQTQISNVPHSPVSSQYHTTPRHVISPNINNRINNLLQNSNNSIDNSNPLPYSPPRLRSHTQRFHLTNRNMHFDPQPSV